MLDKINDLVDYLQPVLSEAGYTEKNIDPSIDGSYGKYARLFCEPKGCEYVFYLDNDGIKSRWNCPASFSEIRLWEKKGTIFEYEIIEYRENPYAN